MIQDINHPDVRCCRWGKCNGVGYKNGSCNRCGSPVTKRLGDDEPTPTEQKE